MPHKTAEARAAYNRAYRVRYPEKRQRLERRYADSGQKYWASILRKFGLTKQEYLAMNKTQGHVCASCGQPETRRMYGRVMRLAVDHDHVTKRNRGLLCSSCNIALGLLRDSLVTIEMLHQYLRVHSTRIALEISRHKNKQEESNG